MLSVLVLVGVASVCALVMAARGLDSQSWRGSLLAIELLMPVGLAVEDIARWLNTVAAATHRPRLSLLPHPPVVLEVVASHSGIRFVLLVPRPLRATALSGLRAALPGVRLTELPTYLKDRPPLAVGAEGALTTRSRQTAVQRAEGTATALLATLQPLRRNEQIVVQWIVTGAGTPGPVTSQPATGKGDLSLWLTDELTDGEAIRAARIKQTDAWLSACVRVGVRATTAARSQAILGRVFGQLRGMNATGVLIVRRWWLWPEWAAERLTKMTIPVLRWPMLLGTRELAGLLPVPVGEVALPGVALGLARQLPPPPGLPKRGVRIGVSNYPDMKTPLRLAAVDRLQHVHVLGPTGVGKSTLLANVIVKDIAAGHGVVVIDPKSDLVAEVLARVPERRAADVVLLDPAATDRPVGFNLLQSAHDEQSRELVVDHVIHIWHELYEDFWGPRSEDVLRGALLSLINSKGANGEAFTLIEAPEILTNAPFRKFVTEQDTVPAGLESFWHWYRGIRPDERLRIIGPILNKLRAATLRTPIRLMLGQSNGIDLDAVLAERRILLVPLSAGTLGTETAGLLGSVTLAGLWFAIMRRVALPASARHPVFVYLDEAQTVLNLPVDLADMLAQARGLGAGFTLAHQHLGQIDDKQVKSALLGTVRTQILFQTMREDAAALAPSYEPRLTAADLMGLAPYEIAVRAVVDNQTLAPFTGTTLPLPPAVRDGQALAETSRQRLGKPRSEVEAALKVRGRAPAADDRSEPARSRRSKGNTFGRRRKSTEDTGVPS